MEVVVAVLLAGFVLVAIVVSIIALLVWHLRRRNRISPDHPCAAPLTWLAALHGPARVHRRLRNTVLVARSAAAEYPTVAELARQIEAQAISLDRHALVAARLRSQRAVAMDELTRQVDSLEALTARLANAAIDAARLPALAGQLDDPLQQIAERLDALDAARADLAALERRTGLEPPREPGSIESRR